MTIGKDDRRLSTDKDDRRLSTDKDDRRLSTDYCPKQKQFFFVQKVCKTT
jgi:hypothetical protein